MQDSKIHADSPDWSRGAKRSFTWEPSRSLLAGIRDYSVQFSSRPGLLFTARGIGLAFISVFLDLYNRLAYIHLCYKLLS